MAHVAVSALSKQEHDELACTYAALLLHDGDLEISEEKLKQVLTASNNSVEGYWPGLFAKALKGRNVADLLANAGSAAAPAKEDKKAKKEEKGKSYFLLTGSREPRPFSLRLLIFSACV
jgi:large subunit ribosomal protein LP1